MDIMPYISNAYSGNTALIVGLDSTNKVIAGNAIYDVNDDINDVLAVMQSAELSAYDGIDTSKYNVYTVDLQGYRHLYVSIDNVLHSVFDSWYNVLDEWLKNDMSMTMHNNECVVNVLSIGQSRFIETAINKHLRTASSFKRNSISAARLINIAIPKRYAMQGFYAECQVLTKNDGAHQQMQVVQYERRTYNMSDYGWLQYSKGQSVFVRKQADTAISVVMHSSDGDASKVLCVDMPIAQIQQLEAYCTMLDAGTYWQIQFAYNPNRNYVVTSNSNMYATPAIEAGTVIVNSKDMLNHAKALNAIIFDKYMRYNELQPESVVLPEAYLQKRCYPIRVRTWHNTDYDYGDYITKSMLSLTGANYRYTPVQVNDKSYDAKWFSKPSMAMTYGNLHTFMLEPSKVLPKLNSQLHILSPLQSIDGSTVDFDYAFSSVNLPVVYNGLVTFRNITYGFQHNGVLTKYFDGKRFCLVLRHTPGTLRPFAELKWSSNYCCIVVSIDLSNVLQVANKEHIGVDSLTIDDFYIANAVMLNPGALAYFASGVQGTYTVYANASMERLCLQLPLN